MTTPTYADDCETMIRLIEHGALSIDEMLGRLGWSNHYINRVLCDLRLKGTVAFEETRCKGKKVKKYSLKLR